MFKDIYADSKSTEKNWYGHTYLRWSSFGQHSPTEHILSTDILVYIVACSNDRNTAVLGTDYLYLESIRQGKTNITYNVYPYDHAGIAKIVYKIRKLSLSLEGGYQRG